MEMVLEVTLKTLWPFWALFFNFGEIWCHSRPQNYLNVLGLSRNHLHLNFAPLVVVLSGHMTSLQQI